MTWTSIEAEWMAMTRRIRADRAEGVPAERATRDGVLRTAMPVPDGGGGARSAAAAGTDDRGPATLG